MGLHCLFPVLFLGCILLVRSHGGLAEVEYETFDGWEQPQPDIYDDEPIFHHRIKFIVYFLAHNVVNNKIQWHLPPTGPKTARCDALDLLAIATRRPSINDFSVTVSLPGLVAYLEETMRGLQEEYDLEIISVSGNLPYMPYVPIYTEIDGQMVNVSENYEALRKYLLKQFVNKVVPRLNMDQYLQAKDLFPDVIPEMQTNFKPLVVVTSEDLDKMPRAGRSASNGMPQSSITKAPPVNTARTLSAPAMPATVQSPTGSPTKSQNQANNEQQQQCIII